MGNSDGLSKCIATSGTNNVVNINKNWYFSFAHGDEIALVQKGKVGNNYYILNCTEKVWENVCKKIKTTNKIGVIKDWWKKQSKIYEISDWSQDFGELK